MRYPRSDSVEELDVSNCGFEGSPEWLENNPASVRYHSLWEGHNFCWATYHQHSRNRGLVEHQVHYSRDCSNCDPGLWEEAEQINTTWPSGHGLGCSEGQGWWPGSLHLRKWGVSNYYFWRGFGVVAPDMSREKADVSRKNGLKGDNVEELLLLNSGIGIKVLPIRTHLVLRGKRCYGSKQCLNCIDNSINIKIDVISSNVLGKIFGTLASITRRVLNHN